MSDNISERFAPEAMPNDPISEKRVIGPFERVLLRDYGDLLIRQGDSPSLTISAHKAVIDRIEARVTDGRLVLGYRGWRERLGEALTTSPSRKPIRYQLTVTDLASIECQGAGRVTGEDIRCDDLSIRVRGVAYVELNNVEAARIEVNMAAAGKVALNGKVYEQEVVVRGPGYYVAEALVSQKAKVNIQGPGTVTVRVQSELDTTIFGPGRLAYFGAPTLTTRLIGPAVVRKLVDQKLAA